MNINGTNTSNGSTDYSRVTGLATGMDTEAMVKQALAREQAKIDKANQDVQYLKWQQEAYVDTIKDFKDFYNAFDILKSDNMMLSANYAGIKAFSSTENVATAKALPGAMKGNYEVIVNKLAQGAKTQSDSIKTLANKAATATTTLADLGVTSGKFVINLKDKSFTVDVKETENINEFITNIKNTQFGKESLGSYVNISFSELTNKITLETKDTGAGQKLEIVNPPATTPPDAPVAVPGNLEKLLGMTVGGHKEGTNANVSIKAPGETDFVTVDNQATNSFIIDNINYNLISTSLGSEISPADPKNPKGTATIITAKADATEIVDKFKKFVEKYNTIVEKFNTKITEKKQYTYKPLTDAQKSSMKEDEIKKWEIEAKKGVLRREESITRVLSGMRSAMFQSVENAGISLSEVGISTTSSYMDGGKIKLDETKLKSALEEKGDLVQKLFIQTGTKDSEKGIFQRIKDTFDKAIGINGTLIKKAGYTDSKWASNNDISNNIKNKNEIITNLQKKMATKQQRLYSMYAALEKSMNQLNSQSNWLGSQLG